MKDSKTISTRISLGMYSELDKHSDKIKKTPSTILREALYTYLDMREDVELMPVNRKIIDNNKRYIKAFNEQRYRELENTVISETLMKNTFVEFMDNFIAQVYITNKPYKSTSELKEIIKDSLECLRERAEHSDELKAYNERLETPIEYAEEFLDRKATERKAFEDSNFDVSIGP